MSEWKTIDSAPFGTTVLLTGESGYMKPHDVFVINGYRIANWHNGNWNDVCGTRLSDSCWEPTHWKEVGELPTMEEKNEADNKRNL